MSKSNYPQGSILLNCTTKCNFRCNHCLREVAPTRKEDKDIDLELLKKILNQIKNLKFILITGGEPILHSRFNEMIDIIAKKNISFGIITNGYFYKKYQEMIERHKEKIDYMSISIDGADPKTHDLLRYPSSFKRAIEAVKFFKKYNIPIITRTCINKINYHQIEKILFFLDSLKVDNIFIFSIISTPLNRNISVQIQDEIKFLNIVEKFKPKIKTKLRPYDAYLQSCNNSLTITPLGDLTFCTNIIGDKLGKIGSFKENTFKKLMDREKIISKNLGKIAKEFMKNNNLQGFNSCGFCNYYFLNHEKEVYKNV